MSMKSKIEKILAKARSTNSESEAATFLAMAERLMEEHQIGIMDLGEDDPMGRYDAYSATPSSPTWKNHVLNQVASYYGATVVRSGDRKRFKFVVCGAESARITTELMYPFIIEQIRAEGRKCAAEMGLKPEAAIRRVGNAFCHKVAKLVADERSKKVVAGTKVATRNSLVMVDALAAYMEEEWGHLRSTKGRGSSTNAVARKAAANVSLNRQTTGASTLKIG